MPDCISVDNTFKLVQLGRKVVTTKLSSILIKPVWRMSFPATRLTKPFALQREQGR